MLQCVAVYCRARFGVHKTRHQRKLLHYFFMSNDNSNLHFTTYAGSLVSLCFAVCVAGRVAVCVAVCVVVCCVMCCSVLECVVVCIAVGIAVCCSVLQCVAVWIFNRF